MKTIEKKIISNFEEIEHDVYSKFGSLWAVENSFEKHINKRIQHKHIKDRNDYIDKTVECLADCDEYIFAKHDKSWDNLCYNKAKDWAVIFNEDGRIMTSYRIEESRNSYKTIHQKIKATINQGVPDGKFKKYFKKLRN